MLIVGSHIENLLKNADTLLVQLAALAC